MPAQYHIAGTTARGIAESIERAIDGGRFADGEALPTIRSLADRLAVSPTTVNAAFAMLRRRGRIVGRSRGGSIVVGRTGFQTGAAAAAGPPHGRNLAVANPDPAFLPPMRRALGARLVERRLYTDIGDSAALCALARRAFERDGVPGVHVGVVSGAMDAIERALVASLVPGDSVALEDPGYPPYADLARVLGLRVLRVGVDKGGLVPGALREAVRAGAVALITVPRAHNPTGVSLDAGRARELARILAAAPELLVIEDDFLAGVAGVPLASLVPGRKRWIHVRSYAKTLGPDLRVGTFAADSLTAARIRDRQRLGCGWVSLVLQEAAATLLADPKTIALLRSAEATYRERREGFVRALARRGVKLPAGTGFTVWVPVRDEAEAVRNAQAAGFAIDGGARYRESAPPGVRVAITTLTAAEAELLADAITAVGIQGP